MVLVHTVKVDILIIRQVLAEHKVTTFASLRKMDPGLIETVRIFSRLAELFIELFQWLNRKPPFGHEVLAAVKQLPQYTLNLCEIDVSKHIDAVEVELSIECGVVREGKVSGFKKSKKPKRYDQTVVLTLTSDNNFIDFRRISWVHDYVQYSI